MEPISIQYSVNMLNHETAGGAGPDASASEQFNQYMQGQEASGISGHMPAVNAINEGVEGVGSTMGDKILSGLQGMRSGFDSQVGAIQESLKGTDPMSINEMMGLQLDLAKLTLQGELINKTVSKSTQNLDTLLKSQ